MSGRTSSAIRSAVRRAALAAAAIVAATLAAAVAAAQTPSSTPRPKIQPDSFNTPTTTSKAAPVKPAKSCDTYGDGFIYVASLDTCVKLNGSVRSDTTIGR